MKNKRKRMIYMIATLALSMSFFLIGVYSSVNRTVSVSGTITFTASNVLVDYEIYKSAPYATGNPAFGDSLNSGAFDADQSSDTASFGELITKEYEPFVAVKTTFKRKSNFNRDFHVKVTILIEPIEPIEPPFIEEITINHDDLLSDEGLLVSSGTGTVDVIIYFEAKTNHTHKTTQTSNISILIDLQLTPFS